MKTLLSLTSLTSIYLKNTFRNPQKLLYLFFFSFLIVVIFAFSFHLPPKVLNRVIPGIVWVVIILGSTPMLSDSFKEEGEGELFYRYMLSPVSMTSLLLTRSLANIVLVMVWEVLVLFLIFIFLNFNLQFNLALFFFVTFIGSVGYVMLTTFFSMIVGHHKNIFMAIIIYPLILPLLMAVLKMSTLILQGNIQVEFYFWMKIAISFDFIYLAIMIILTEFLFDG